jgi:membrane glycosyltransferase
MMLLHIFKLGVLVFAIAYGSPINLFIHIEFVLTVNIGAEVLWQVSNMANLDLEIESLINHVLWIISQQVLIDFFIAIWLTWNHIEMDHAIHLIACGYDWN